MADVYGRLTGKAGVCIGTLGPGATNLITGVADANMDHAPLVAIAGQASTQRLHKESHQVLDLEEMFRNITKYSARLLTPNIIPEVVRKAFKVAQTEKSGACFIEFPENIAEMDVEGEAPLSMKQPVPPEPPQERVELAAKIISDAKHPIILAGNGVIRAKAWKQLHEFSQGLNIPVANTFMAKGVVPFAKNPLALGSAGLQAKDYVSCGFDRADVVICVGYDLVEYHPYLWHPTKDRTIIHIDMSPAEVDAYYPVAVGVLGDIKHSLNRIRDIASNHTGNAMRGLRKALVEDMSQHKDNNNFPVTPQKIIWDRHLRRRRAQDVDGAHVPLRGAQHLPDLQWLRQHGHRRARRHRRQAGLPGSQGGGGDRRCRLYDEFAGDRNRHAHRHALRGPDLERQCLWPDRVETDEWFWTQVEYRLQQS